MEIHTDFLIVGGGIAGLSLAAKLSRMGQVLVLSKKEARMSATDLAQGGIACVSSADDSFESHYHDTLRAGDGLCHEDIVDIIVRQAPDRVRELEEWGVRFTCRSDGTYDLGKEGGHSHRRVVHAGDFTGRAIQKALIELVRDNKSITLLRDHVAVDVITECKLRGACANQPSLSGQGTCRERCLGMYVLDVASGEVRTIISTVTVLATGGAGKVYLYTSNPDVSTGDGIAIAYRAGARVANLEFVQFHPTCLYHHKAKNFLISEALRGEGARLLDASGNAFMERYAPERQDLACRDIVARAIDAELKKSGAESVFLDISHRPADFIKERFPNIYETCLGFGMDITKEPIPVVPAAHYMCGGVVTDRYGQTDICGLYAVGETACTGLHGANRLASNSLLEGLVMAHQAFTRIQKDFEELKAMKCPPVQPWDTGGAVDMDEAVLISHNWDVIRRLMWDYVGIVRSDKRLNLAKRRIKPIIEEINRHYWDYILTRDFLELRNLSMVAELIVHSASLRKESRGGHYNMDWPDKDDWNWRRDSLLCRETGPV